MSETNKVILAAILGILVGFGVGRLIDSKGGEPVERDNADTAAVSTSAIVSNSDEVTVDEVVDGVVTADMDTGKADTMAASSNVSTLNSVFAGDQPAGVNALVNVSLERVGWVTIHEDRGGMPGNILGAKRFGPGSGTVSVMLLRAMLAESKYYAALRADDGDELFDYKKDLPIMNASGDAIMHSFGTTAAN